MPSPRIAPVAVFDADAPPAIAFTRSLGRAGVPVHVYSHGPWGAAGLSRYALRTSSCPDLEDEARFVPWLRQQLESGAIERVAPTSDLIAYYLSELRDHMGPEARAMIPTREATRDALFKDRFATRATALGIYTPRTVSPSSLEEARDLAGGLDYPVVIKPRSHVAGRLERGEVVHSAEELRRLYRRSEVGPGMLPILERMPELGLPVLQEYLPQIVGRLVSVSGVLGSDGSVVAVSGSKKRHQWPPSLGVGLVFEPWVNAEAISLGADIARQILDVGLFELEIARDEERDRWIAIDLNPRAHGFIALDIARGNDLPALWRQLCDGERPAPPSLLKDELRWVHSIPLHLSYWVDIAFGPARAEQAKAYARDLTAKRVDIVHNGDDRLATLAYAAKMLRHPGGLIRPFVKQKLAERRARSSDR